MATPQDPGPSEAPSPEPTHDVTSLLHAWRDGDAAAGEALLARIYPELRRMARYELRRERRPWTLDPTALAHECFLRLVDQRRGRIHDRAHFFAVAATMMRRVLVSQARARLARKRRHAAVPITQVTILAGTDAVEDPELLDLDGALARLAETYPRQARVVEMRFFAGMSEEEIATALEVTERTIRRDWTFARAWLSAELAKPASVDAS